MADVKFCPQCGAPVENAGSNICTQCGCLLKKKTKGVSTVFIVIMCILVSSPVIFGIVAALTIPSLINRQSQIASKTIIKKSIANYKNAAAIYMAENDVDNFNGALGYNCENAENYFPIVEQDGCNFTTADKAYWEFDPYTGSAAVSDNQNSPKYNVLLWTVNGETNKNYSRPSYLKYPTTQGSIGTFSAEEFLYQR